MPCRSPMDISHRPLSYAPSYVLCCRLHLLSAVRISYTVHISSRERNQLCQILFESVQWYWLCGEREPMLCLFTVNAIRCVRLRAIVGKILKQVCATVGGLLVFHSTSSSQWCNDHCATSSACTLTTMTGKILALTFVLLTSAHIAYCRGNQTQNSNLSAALRYV